MKKWFIADTHFSHKNIIKYTGRPFASIEEMDRTLIENWNHNVNQEYQFFFLGDFGMGDIEHLQSICVQLNGNKNCIRGNHDVNSSSMYHIGFSVLLEASFLGL